MATIVGTLGNDVPGGGADSTFVAGGSSDDISTLDPPVFANTVSNVLTLTDSPRVGTDTVQTIIGFHELKASFENLVFTPHAARLNGRCATAVKESHETVLG